MNNTEWNKNTYKKFKCCYCHYKPTDISDLTFGEFSPNETKWACFDHVDKLWKSFNPDIKNQSDYWNHMEKTNGKSPRPVR